MKALLEFYLRYFDFLYLDSRYRFTDSKTDGANAAITVTGPDLTWSVSVDRGQFQLSIAPTRSPRTGFWVSLIKQYLEGNEDIAYLSAKDEVEWARGHLGSIEQLFADPAGMESVCNELRILQRANAEKQWGPAATN